MRPTGVATAIALLLIAAGAGWSPGANAAFPGRDGRLMWVESKSEEGDNSLNSPNGRLFFVFQRPARGERRDDTGTLECDNRDPRGPCPYLNPSFSPDGETVLLEAYRALDPGAPLPGIGDPLPARRPVLALVGANRVSTTFVDVLPDLTERDRDPAWSPDGRRIVFSGEVGGNRDLYVVNRDGSGLRRLTSGPALDREPAWSKGGEIAFARGRVLYRIRPDGTGLERLDRRGRRPDWSPDGRRLVFSHERRLFLLGRDGSGYGPVLRQGFGSEPAWSPSGRRIAFRRKRAIYTVGFRGGGLRRVSASACCLTRGGPYDIDWGPRQR